jgi:hypothetical protein
MPWYKVHATDAIILHRYWLIEAPSYCAKRNMTGEEIAQDIASDIDPDRQCNEYVDMETQWEVEYRSKPTLDDDDHVGPLLVEDTDDDD